MSQTNYEQTIVAGVRRLSPERQREVADFVYFLRQREEEGASYEQLIERDLADFESEELNHLEEEFAGYDQTFPRR